MTDSPRRDLLSFRNFSDINRRARRSIHAPLDARHAANILKFFAAGSLMSSYRQGNCRLPSAPVTNFSDALPRVQSRYLVTRFARHIKRNESDCAGHFREVGVNSLFIGQSNCTWGLRRRQWSGYRLWLRFNYRLRFWLNYRLWLRLDYRPWFWLG